MSPPWPRRVAEGSDARQLDLAGVLAADRSGHGDDLEVGVPGVQVVAVNGDLADSGVQFTATTTDFALWADDADWVIGGTEGQPFERRAHGVDDIVDLFRDLRGEREYFVQFVTQGPIEINGDEATAHCVCHEAARGPGESY